MCSPSSAPRVEVSRRQAVPLCLPRRPLLPTTPSEGLTSLGLLQASRARAFVSPGGQGQLHESSAVLGKGVMDTHVAPLFSGRRGVELLGTVHCFLRVPGLAPKPVLQGGTFFQGWLYLFIFREQMTGALLPAVLSSPVGFRMTPLRRSRMSGSLLSLRSPGG